MEGQFQNHFRLSYVVIIGGAVPIGEYRCMMVIIGTLQIINIADIISCVSS